MKVAQNLQVAGEPLSIGQRTALVTEVLVGGPTGTKGVLMILHAYSGQNPYCWPCMTTIARQAEVSLRSARRSIGYLAGEADEERPDWPLLVFKDRARGRHSRVYWIQYPALDVLVRRQRQERHLEVLHPNRNPGHSDRTPGQGDLFEARTPATLAGPPATLAAVNKQQHVVVNNSENRPGLRRIRNLAEAGAWRGRARRLVRKAIPALSLEAVDAALEAAATEDRVIQVLRMIQEREPANPAGYFVAACRRPDWS